MLQLGGQPDPVQSSRETTTQQQRLDNTSAATSTGQPVNCSTPQLRTQSTSHIVNQLTPSSYSMSQLQRVTLILAMTAVSGSLTFAAIHRDCSDAASVIGLQTPEYAICLHHIINAHLRPTIIDFSRPILFSSPSH